MSLPQGRNAQSPEHGSGSDVLDQLDFPLPSGLSAKFAALGDLGTRNHTPPEVIEKQRAGYRAACRALITAGVSIFQPNYFKVPWNGVLLNIVSFPMQLTFGEAQHEVQRVLFSSETINKETGNPVTLVDDYILDKSARRVYRFEGKYGGIAEPGATVHDVTWQIYLESPPSFEYGTDTSLGVLLNGDYETTLIADVAVGSAVDGAAALVQSLRMGSELEDYRKEVGSFTLQTR